MGNQGYQPWGLKPTWQDAVTRQPREGRGWPAACQYTRKRPLMSKELSMCSRLPNLREVPVLSWASHAACTNSVLEAVVAATAQALSGA